MKALSFGEILWDIIEGQEYLGGAPLNVAAHLAQMGCESLIVSRLGTDRRGAAARREISLLGADAALVLEDPHHCTGFVEVSVDEQGNPSYTIHENVAYDFVEFEDQLLGRLTTDTFDVFCFGTLCQRCEVSRNTLRRMLDTLRAINVFYDVNLRQNYYSRDTVALSLARSSIVKLNSEEYRVLSELLFGGSLQEEEFGQRIRGEYGVRVLCITKGAEGCTVYDGTDKADCPGAAVKVADTVGSGDAFSAAFLYQYCRGASASESASVANGIGAYVASKAGAIPAYTDEIRKALS